MRLKKNSLKYAESLQLREKLHLLLRTSKCYNGDTSRSTCADKDICSVINLPQLLQGR